MRLTRAVAATILLAASASTVQAQVSLVTDRSHITGSLIDWAGLYGPAPVPTADVFNGWKDVPLTETAISVSSIGTLSLQHQGSDWNGNFGHNDPLLRSTYSPISILFNSDVHAFGANIQNAWWGSFTGVMSAFGANDELLGTVELGGTSNAIGGTAIFLGISSVDAIRRITIGTTGSWDDFAINQASFGELAMLDEQEFGRIIVEQELPIITNPEPGTVALLAAGMMVLGVSGYRRRRTQG